MDLGLSGRVAIITGASRGIGRTCAAALAAEGAHVVLASLDPARNTEACAAIKSRAKGKVLGIPTDFTKDDAVRALFERTMNEFGRLDILVNNAAYVGAGDFFALDEKKLAEAFEHKLNGTVRCSRHAIPPMRARTWGRIINVAGRSLESAARRDYRRTQQRSNAEFDRRLGQGSRQGWHSGQRRRADQHPHRTPRREHPQGHGKNRQFGGRSSGAAPDAHHRFVRSSNPGQMRTGSRG